MKIKEMIIDSMFKQFSQVALEGMYGEQCGENVH